MKGKDYRILMTYRIALRGVREASKEEAPQSEQDRERDRRDRQRPDNRDGAGLAQSRTQDVSH